MFLDKNTKLFKLWDRKYQVVETLGTKYVNSLSLLNEQQKSKLRHLPSAKNGGMGMQSYQIPFIQSQAKQILSHISLIWKRMIHGEPPSER